MVESYAIRTIPFYFIANVEEVVEEMDFESCDVDYSYDEDSDGNMKKRKSKNMPVCIAATLLSIMCCPCMPGRQNKRA